VVHSARGRIGGRVPGWCILPKSRDAGGDSSGPSGSGAGGDNILTSAPERSNGLGWGLTLLDTLMSEYPGYTRRTAMREHLSIAFLLYAACCARHDRPPRGPSYADMDMLDAIRAARAAEAAEQKNR